MGALAVINGFKEWIEELAATALNRKADEAKITGIWPKWTNPVKNREIKEKFAYHGRLINGVRSRSSSDKKHKEWLYDLIWQEFDKENNFIGCLLVMEIEFSDMKKSGLLYDFNKLLQADSDYKVFVCQQKTEKESRGMLEVLKDAAGKYRAKSESDMLIACWCWELSKFLFSEVSLVPCLKKLNRHSVQLGPNETSV